MKKIRLVFLTSLLIAAASGCASVNQAYTAYSASGMVAARTAQDNVVETLIFTICAVPYGTVIRKPEFQEVAKAACLPSAVPRGNGLLPLPQQSLLPEPK